MVYKGEWKYKETFKQFELLTAAITFMNKKLLVLQNKAWVANAKEVEECIETWLYIYSSGMEVLGNRSACDTWVCDVQAFGNLHVYSTLGQLTNDVGSNTPCRLRRAIEKLSTIHSHVGILIRFAFSARIRFMLAECTLVMTLVKLNAPVDKQLWPSTETEWRKVLQGIYKR